MKRKKNKYERVPFHSGKDKRAMAIKLKRKGVLKEANERLAKALEGLKSCKSVSDKEIDLAFLRARRAEGKDLENAKIFEDRLKIENELLQTLVKEGERVKRQEIKLHGMQGVINAQPVIKAAAHARNALKLNQDLLKDLQQAKRWKEKNG